MIIKEKFPLWSDNIFIEKNKAWFSAGNVEAIFESDDNLNTCHFLKEFPDFKFCNERRFSRCMKIDRDLFCFPNTGNCIWVYSLENGEFQKIEIDNQQENQMVIISNFWQIGNEIFVLSNGLKKILDVSIREKKVVQYYDISNDQKETLGNSTIVGKSIFIISRTNRSIYEFNIETKKVLSHVIPNLKGNLNTICYGDGLFWLSGYDKFIYLWNKENNTVKSLNDFPQEFGQYDFTGQCEKSVNCSLDKYEMPAFIGSFYSGKYIWFIPFQTNKIIYVDKMTKQINTFEILEEEENRSTLLNRIFPSKYLLQYFGDNKKLGLYSIKNQMVLEIDTETLSYEYRDVLFDPKEMKKLVNKYRTQFGIMNEKKQGLYYQLLLDSSFEKVSNEAIGKIGTEIYNFSISGMEDV